jgi:Mrp family chromosome partitioning ATPase
MDSSEALQKFVQYTEIKNLLDRIILLQEQEKFRSIAVLSELDGDGKTFITAVLALAHTARLKKKVLVVDTSSAHANSQPGPAMTRKKTDLLAELLEHSTAVDLISLRDWENPKATVDEYQLKALFDQVASKYALVIVDTSSLSRKNRNNFDPVVIARQCDVSILVGAHKPVDPDVSAANKKRITDSSIKLVGMVQNQWVEPVSQPNRKQGSVRS